MTQMILGHDNCISIVLEPATNDKGLAMTASFTNMVICGQALANVWNLESYRSVLGALSKAAPSFLAKAADLAASLADRGLVHACFLGTGVLTGVASESALKLLELTAGKAKTMSQTTLGLRHGPMAALDKETLLVQFLSCDATRRRYELDLLREIEGKNLVDSIIAVCGGGSCDLEGLSSTKVLYPDEKLDLSDSYRPPIDVMFGQCLGLFASLKFGLTPDTPSPTGAINRVVPAFEIH